MCVWYRITRLQRHNCNKQLVYIYPATKQLFVCTISQHHLYYCVFTGHYSFVQSTQIILNKATEITKYYIIRIHIYVYQDVYYVDLERITHDMNNCFLINFGKVAGMWFPSYCGLRNCSIFKEKLFSLGFRSHDFQIMRLNPLSIATRSTTSR